MSDKLKDVFFYGLLVTLLFGAGCSDSMSSFYMKFSLQELIKGNEFTAGLDCGNSGGPGMTIGTGGVGAEQSNFSKTETCVCQITDAKLFDEAKFIEGLKAGVEKDLGANKATIVSSKDSAGGFILEYTSNEIKGTIQISGGSAKSVERIYMLQAKVTEREDTK